MPHEKIVELIFVIEACEGLAATRVLDKRRGIVELLLAPDLAPDLERLIEDLARSFPIARVPRPEGVASIADDGNMFKREGEE
jgi:hypothetical protein